MIPEDIAKLTAEVLADQVRLRALQLMACRTLADDSDEPLTILPEESPFRTAAYDDIFALRQRCDIARKFLADFLFGDFSCEQAARAFLGEKYLAKTRENPKKL
jgi:hypothetical protein